MRRLTLVALALVAAAVAATPASARSPVTRPVKGDCSTTFSFAGTADGNPQVHITGSCHFTHLGRATWDALQTLYPDGTIENDGTYTAADGDTLSSHVVGTGLPVSVGSPLLALQYREWYTAGTGRFADVVVADPGTDPPDATGSGWANLADSTGWFAAVGSIAY